MKKTEFISFVKILLLAMTLSLFNKSWGQNQTNDFSNHLRFGGGIGLSFGDGFFSGTLAPSVIYQFDQPFALGIAANATFNSLKNTYDSTILGGSIIGLYNVIPEIQLSAEFEELNVTRKYKEVGVINYTESYWYPALFVGAGFRTHNVTVGIRYDLLYDKYKSLYANAYAPFIRVYF